MKLRPLPRSADTSGLTAGYGIQAQSGRIRLTQRIGASMAMGNEFSGRLLPGGNAICLREVPIAGCERIAKARFPAPLEQSPKRS